MREHCPVLSRRRTLLRGPGPRGAAREPAKTEVRHEILRLRDEAMTLVVVLPLAVRDDFGMRIGSSELF